MVRFLLVFFVTTIFLYARENPFTPIITPKESGDVSKPLEPNFFISEELRLPSSARKIRKIAIEYQGIDGAIKSIEKELDHEIDWHFPIIVSQDVILDSKINSLNSPSLVIAPQITQNRQTFEPFKFLKIDIDNKILTIKTPDVKIRHFAVADPTKIVVDLKREVKFRSQIIETDAPYFEEIAIGNHGDSYRVAIKLDGQYKYTLDERKDGFVIELR